MSNESPKQVIIEQMQRENCLDQERIFLQSVNPIVYDNADHPSIWAWPPKLAGEQDVKRFGAAAHDLLCGNNGWDNPYWWIRQPDGTPVGMIKYNRSLDREGLRNQGHVALSIAEPYRNQGYGTAAMHLVKDVLHLPDCLCIVDAEHDQMRHIIEACGGKYWDMVKVQRYAYVQEEPHDGKPVFSVWMRHGEFRQLCRYWL